MGKRRKTWGPFCENPRTVSSGAQVCPVAWKYGTLGVFKLLCPDCRTTSAGERFCGVVEDDRQHRREVSLSRVVALGGVLTVFWLGLAAAIVGQVATEPTARQVRRLAISRLRPPLVQEEPPTVTEVPEAPPRREPDVATVSRPDKPAREPASPERLRKPPEPKRKPASPHPKPKSEPEPEPEPVPAETPEQARARAQDLVAEGDRHLAEGRYMEASIAYSGASRRDPSNVCAHLGVGRCHLRQQKRPREARSAFEEALRLDPSLVEAQVALCRLGLAEPDHERATTHALEAKRLRPGDPAIFMLLSACHEASGDRGAALREVVAALALDSVTGGTCLAAGEFYLRHDDPAKAEGAYRRAIELGGDSEVARGGLARALRGQGKLALARQELDAVLKEAPQAPDATAELAEVLMAQGDAEAAVATFEELVHRHPERHDSRAKLASLLLALGRTDAAAVAAQRALRADPDNAIGHLVLAEAFVAAGLCTMAQGHCEQALRANSDNVRARMLLARCHSAKKRYDLVLRELKALLATDAQHLQAQLLLGQTYQALGQLNEAKECFQTAAKQHPKSPEPALGLGDVQLRRGFPEVAMLCYEDAKRLAPNSPAAASRLAIALLDHGGDTDRAYRLAEDLKERFPTHAVTWDAYGWACHRRGRLEEAVRSLSVAAVQLPDDPAVRYHHGAALYRVGRIGEAETELRAAVDLSDTFVGVKDAKAILARISKKRLKPRTDR